MIAPRGRARKAKRHFQWKAADDVLHVVIGAALVVIGLTGRHTR
jgi:hypothetical protein